MRANGIDGEEGHTLSVVSGSPHCIHILISSMDISVHMASSHRQCP